MLWHQRAGALPKIFTPSNAIDRAAKIKEARQNEACQYNKELGLH